METKEPTKQKPKQETEQKISSQRKPHPLALFALLYAFLLLLIMISDCAAASTERSDPWLWYYFFTNQSNFMVLVWLAALGITSFLKDSKFKNFIHNRIVMTALTVYITITFLIVAFVLTPVYKGEYMTGIGGAMFFTHFITTIVMWIYYFFVPGKGDLKLRHALYILIYPALYLVLNLIVGGTTVFSDHTDVLTGEFVTGKAAYAYAFVNPASYSNIGIYICVLLGLVAVFAALGMGLIKFKQYLVKYYYDK